jgi:glycosyltransferase involved in cell wall biosynthesis
VVSVATVAHVIDQAMARGAQAYLRSLQSALDGQPDHHRIITLFEGEPGLGDIELGVRPGRARSLGLDVGAVWRLRAALRRLGCDVVVAHGGESLKYVVAAGRSSPHFVYHKIGTSAEGLAHPVRRALYRRLAGRADVVVGVSQEMADEAGRLLGVPRARRVAIPNGRDPSLYAPSPEGPSHEPARLLFVGHLTPSKRPDVFIDVVNRLRGQGLVVDAAIVGDGPLGSHLASRSAQSGVEMLGRRDDVASLLARSDVFVFPSVAEGEGLPGVMVEAALAGLPIVTTDVPGANAVVDDGVSGYVVDVDDIEGLAAAAAKLVADPALRMRMGSSGRRRAVARFGLQASTAAWQSLFDRLAGRQAARPTPDDIVPASVVCRRPVAVREVAGYVLLAAADGGPDVLSLSGTAPTLWAALDGYRSLAEIGADLAGAFDAPPDEITASLVAVARTLVAHGLVEVR